MFAQIILPVAPTNDIELMKITNLPLKYLVCLD